MIRKLLINILLLFALWVVPVAKGKAKYAPFSQEKPEEETVRITVHPGQTKAWKSVRRFILLSWGHQSGKALPLDTTIPCPQGFRTMGDLQAGDTVYDEDGAPCVVTRVTREMVGHRCYRITFDEGVSIVADADHLWRIQDRRQRKNQARHGKHPSYYSVMTTEELLFHPERWRPCSIDMPGPVQFPERELPIPPYTFGAWLGDGNARGAHIYSADLEVPAMIADEGVRVGEGTAQPQQGKALTYTIGQTGRSRDPVSQKFVANTSIASKLQNLRVWQNKHIPDLYLTASVSQRLALLCGLMDTDGYCGWNGTCEISTVKPVLARDILTLLRSLGIKARSKEKRTTCGSVIGTAYRITFTTDTEVFSLPRKKHQKATVRSDVKRRFIRSIVPAPSVPVKCIEVDSPNEMYLASRDFVPTHNTCFGPYWLLREIKMRGPGDYLAVSATFPLLNLRMIVDFQDVFEHKYKLGTYRAGEKVFIFHEKYGKTRVIFASATNPESIESATALAAWCDEAGQDQFPRAAWEAITRRLSINQGRVLFTTTPYNLGWIKQEIHDRWQAGDTDYDVIHFDSRDNPAFPEEEDERQKSILPPWKYDMFLRGLFTRPAGLIYDCFDEETCKIARFPIDPTWPRYVGHDFGPVNMAAIWYAMDPGTGFLYAYREYLKSGEDLSAHTQEWKELSHGEPIRRRVGGAPSEDNWRDGCARQGWPISKPRHRDVMYGIQAVYGWHKENRLFVFSDMHGYLHEKLSYSWKLDEHYEPIGGEIEDKQKFHRMDAERGMLSELDTSHRDERDGEEGDVIQVVSAGQRDFGGGR